MRAPSPLLMVLCLAVGPVPGAAAPAAPSGAQACTGCHGLGPEAPYPIHQLGAEGIAEAMIVYRSGVREATLMDRIAAGFDEAEIAVIAAWFAEHGGEE